MTHSRTRTGIVAALVAGMLIVGTSKRAHADSSDAAKIHYLSGSSYYKQGRYLDALREFEEANRMSNRAALLYNIALCQKQLTRFAEAVRSLREYLRRTPDAGDRVAVNEEIVALEKLAAPPAPALPSPSVAAPPVMATPTAAPRPAPLPSHPGMSGRRIASWTLGAGGAALVVTALGVGLGAHSTLTAVGNQCATPQSPCAPADQAQRDQGQRLSEAGWGLAAAGVAAVGTAVVLYLTERRQPAAEPRVSLLPSATVDGGALVLAGRF